MKKRFLAIVLAVVMTLALAVPGFAATVNPLVHHDTYEYFAGQQLVKTSHVEPTGELKYGYVNYAGNVIVQEKYTTLGGFSEGLAPAIKDGVGMYVTPTGQEVITLGVVEEIKPFSNGVAEFKKDGNWYICDTTGKVVVNLGKDEPVTNCNKYGLIVIKTPANKLGIISKTGVHVLDLHYDEIRGFVDVAPGLALAYVRVGTTQGFIDQYGNVRFTVASDLKVSDFTTDGMAKVQNLNAIANPIGYIDYTGYQAVACQYEDGDDFHYGVARIKRNGLWGYIDKTNKYTVQPEYVDLGNWTEGTVVTASKWRTDATGGTQSIIIDENGHLVVTTVPTGTNTYKVWGFVNVLTGAVAVQLQFHAVRPFTEDGLAWVKLWASQGFVSLNGSIAVNLGSYYETVGDSHEGKAWVIKNEKYGYVGTTAGGALVIPMIFDVDRVQDFPALDSLADFQKGFAAASMGTVQTGHLNRYGVINAQGNWHVANQFTWIDSYNTGDMVMLGRNGNEKTRIIIL